MTNKKEKFSLIEMGIVVGILLLFGIGIAVGANTPATGVEATYAVLSSTYTNTSVTTVNGDVGFTTAPAVAPLGTHANYGSGAPYSTAGTAQATLIGSL